MKKQPYWIRKETGLPVESFCLFFAPGWVEEVSRSLLTADAQLLDNPTKETTVVVQFSEKLYPHDTLITPHLMAIRDRLLQHRLTDDWLEEQCHFLLADLLQLQRNVYREAEQLPSVRYATRVELYHRLYRARDYLHASLDHEVTVTHLAQVACMSPYHFLRSFKQLFKQTPHAYLRRLRLAKAQSLLAGTKRPITDICFDVGFQSLGSFSTLFRREFGMSPRAYREQFG